MAFYALPGGHPYGGSGGVCLVTEREVVCGASRWDGGRKMAAVFAVVG